MTSNWASDSSTPSWSSAASFASSTVRPVTSTHSIGTSLPRRALDRRDPPGAARPFPPEPLVGFGFGLAGVPPPFGPFGPSLGRLGPSFDSAGPGFGVSPPPRFPPLTGWWLASIDRNRSALRP